MRLLVLCTCHKVASNKPQGCVPQNYAILLFAYLLLLLHPVALQSALSLNSWIMALTRYVNHFSKKKRVNFVFCCGQIVQDIFIWGSIEGFGGKRVLGFLLKSELCQKCSQFRIQFCLRVSNIVLHVFSPKFALFSRNYICKKNCICCHVSMWP